jgi:hypothetical protein
MLTLSTNPIPTAFCESVRHIDHITYVTSLSSEREFIARWTALGFHEHVRLRPHFFQQRTLRWSVASILSIPGQP